MTISSLPTPEGVAYIDAICHKHLGSPASSIDRIGVGRNSRVFHITVNDRSFVIKFYRRDIGDKRDRLATEFGALRFLWDNGVRVVPRAIADDRRHYCAIYEYLDGEALQPEHVTATDIDALVAFLSSMQPLRGRAAGAAIGIASEASFSLSAVVEHVKSRADRSWKSVPGSLGLKEWFDTSFDPLFADVTSWSREMAGAAGQGFDDEIDQALRTLSPSDFGFHNAIRRPDGSLAFVDFEYFGWDDSAKTLVDFLLHPRMALPETLKKRFAGRFLEAFAFVPGLRDRARIVYPLYGLKWCLILLNDFLPDRETTATRDVLKLQLEKAHALADRIRREYRENPFV